ncbi:MAG: acyl-CoA synthetase [Actinobacteria bacterium]|nr:acyl-CoA synthetase [Actinomycetota bacterium]
MTLTTYNFADVWESVVDRVADRVALVCEGRELTYASIEERSNRLAHVLAESGVGPGDHVGVYLRNCPEYFEAMFACFKLRAVPININYRYVAGELRYLFDDSGIVALIAHRRFAVNVAEVVGGFDGFDPLDAITTVISVDDTGSPTPAGSIDYERALAASSPERDFGPRSDDDRYVIYTGGTTGMPKGVVWRHGDAFFSCIGGGDPMRLNGPVDRPDEVLERIIDFDFVAFPLAPMMHAAAQWTSLSWLYCGARVVMHPGSFDARATWRAVEANKVSTLIIVGDAMARPLVDAWDRHGPFDASSMFALGSGGAPLSAALKDRLMELLPHVMVTDGFGSSETGAQGSHRLQAGSSTGGATRFTPLGDTTTVLDDERRPVAPGSGVIGRVALTGRIPLGYHNDPERTAATFVEVEGRRWVLTGDMATVDDDGTIVLLGRGSQAINTGGEKVFPEEVEGALKSHPAVYDALVVGVPDERFGERVCAVVSLRPGLEAGLDELATHCRSTVAGYKVPRELVVVDEVVRSPVGKADYRWARSAALSALGMDE